MGAVRHLVNQLWWERASLPSYQVGRAAKFVTMSPSTLARWQNLAYVIPKRDRGKGYSYLQLIEAAVVAKMRQAGVKLSDIRSAREFMARKLEREYPFATSQFSTDGIDILMEFDDVFTGDGKGKRVIANKSGQLMWSDMIAKTIRQFEYEQDIAVLWRVAGEDKSIVIDPRVGFGAPTVRGLPTEVVFARYEGGEPVAEIADDYEIDESLIREAVIFEGRLQSEAFRAHF